MTTQEYFQLGFRYTAFGLLALSGVGLLYLISKTIVVKDGYEGVSYDQGTINILKPGMHILLSPFNLFSQMVSMQQEVTEFTIDNIITPDKTPLKIKAILTWRVKDSQKAMMNVDGYRSSLIGTAKGTLTNILRSIEMDQLLPGSDELDAHHDKRLFADIHDKFIKALGERVSEWGIDVKDIIIDDISIPDIKIQEALAERAAAKSRAAARITEANGEAQAKQTLARADVAVASLINESATKLTARNAMEVFQMVMTKLTAKESNSTTLIPSNMQLSALA